MDQLQNSSKKRACLRAAQRIGRMRWRSGRRRTHGDRRLDGAALTAAAVQSAVQSATVGENARAIL